MLLIPVPAVKLKARKSRLRNELEMALLEIKEDHLSSVEFGENRSESSLSFLRGIN